MVFKPENYPPYWKQFSEYVRQTRAKNKCERCGAPNGESIERGHLDGAPIWFDGQGGTYCAKSGTFLGRFRSYDLDLRGFSKIVLTVAHLDHENGICKCKEIYGFKCAKPSHCLALCQSCHLCLDRDSHVLARRENLIKKKDLERGLFSVID